MELHRVLLYGALAFILVLIWEAWQQDYGHQPLAPSTAEPVLSPDIPTAPKEALPADTPDVQERPALQSSERISVTTDLFKIEIDTKGADLRQVDLRDYPVDVNRPDVPIRLLADAGDDLFVAQSGLVGTNGSTAPNHHSHYTTTQTSVQLADGEDTLTIPFIWHSDDNAVEVIKRYHFRRGSYLIEVSHDVRNSGYDTWSGHVYHQFLRSRPESTLGLGGVYTYTGGVIYSREEHYEKIDFGDMDDHDLSRDIQGGWAAMIQHYFLGAWVPEPTGANHYYSKALGNGSYILGSTSAAMSVAAGETSSSTTRLFIGPKLQNRLEEIAEGLELTVDYGLFTIIAKPLFYALEFIYSLVGNWGWAIIFLTILIKLVFYKLSETSYKSMAQMRKLQPRLQSLKERFGDDRQNMHKAMMKIYKEEKINPLGGCLPILVQIPVFIALYWMLLETVEMRQAPFMLWLNDLSSKDPYYVLPLLMGASMLIQHKLNPTPLDPIQAKVMMALPIIFTFFFAFFPSGLVLYWVVNNILSIAQQWYITRIVIGDK